jgi:hypothetical protein
MDETSGKMELLCMLNQEFFTEIREKKDETSLTNYFGGPLGRLLWRHCLLEERFTVVNAE